MFIAPPCCTAPQARSAWPPAVPCASGESPAHSGNSSTNNVCMHGRVHDGYLELPAVPCALRGNPAHSDNRQHANHGRFTQGRQAGGLYGRVHDEYSAVPWASGANPAHRLPPLSTYPSKRSTQGQQEVSMYDRLRNRHSETSRTKISEVNETQRTANVKTAWSHALYLSPWSLTSPQFCSPDPHTHPCCPGPGAA